MHAPLLVGCPLLGREWIIPKWIEHTEAACSLAGVKPKYVFVGDANDDAVHLTITSLVALGQDVFFVHEDENDHDYKRLWNADRYKRMIYLRNTLLAKVRDIGPAFFLSLDSDILLHPTTIARMASLISDYDAVGTKLYMEPPPAAGSRLHQRNNPSFYVLKNGRPKRWDATSAMKVDVIMAAKLMAPPAYKVDYEFHSHGEDVGWSLACLNKGLRLGWDGGVVSKHVMTESHLDRVDPRCGF